MLDAFHFLASWQLFPERGTHGVGERPRSGTFRMEARGERSVFLQTDWVTLENEAMGFSYTLQPDGEWHPFEDAATADEYKAWFPDGISMETEFRRGGATCLKVSHRIMPDGYLRVTEEGFDDNGDRKSTRLNSSH